AAPGDYIAVSVKPGYIIDEVSPLTLAAGVNISHDVELSPGTRVISGSLSDVDTGEKLPGNILFFDTDDTFTFTFTDADGNFEATVIPGVWELEAGAETLAPQGYLTVWSEANAESGNVTGLNLGA